MMAQQQRVTTVKNEKGGHTNGSIIQGLKQFQRGGSSKQRQSQHINQQQQYREDDSGSSEPEERMMQDRFAAYGDSLGGGTSGRQKAW